MSTSPNEPGLSSREAVPSPARRTFRGAVQPTPSQIYRQIRQPHPPPLLKGLDAKVHHLSGVIRRRSGLLSQLQAQAAEVESMAPQFSEMR
ncbi:MAG: hypothetical protein WCR20_17255, partial [Verrucomicrobiota bacterium]